MSCMEFSKRVGLKILGYQDSVSLAKGIKLDVEILNDREIGFKLIGQLTLVWGPTLGPVGPQLTANWVLLLGCHDFLPLG